MRAATLTADSRTAAAGVAAELGIDALCAGVLPGDKDEQIAQLKRKCRSVAMVGDRSSGSRAAHNVPAIIVRSVSARHTRRAESNYPSVEGSFRWPRSLPDLQRRFVPMRRLPAQNRFTRDRVETCAPVGNLVHPARHQSDAKSSTAESRSGERAGFRTTHVATVSFRSSSASECTRRTATPPSSRPDCSVRRGRTGRTRFGPHQSSTSVRLAAAGDRWLHSP